MNAPHLSLDCRDGNHTKCDTVAWDMEKDNYTTCECTKCSHYGKRPAMKYIVIREPGMFLAALGGIPAKMYLIQEDGSEAKLVATGTFSDLKEMADTLNTGIASVTPVTTGQPEKVFNTEQVRPEDVKLGDRMLVEVVVTKIAPVSGVTTHIHAHLKAGQLWQMGNQTLWTWGRSTKGEKKLERIMD